MKRTVEGYIFNIEKMTDDDRMILIERNTTCINRFPHVREFGNGYREQFWYGDITTWPGYEELFGD